jgi:hypothetical protein
MMEGVVVYLIHEINCMVNGGSIFVRGCPKEVTWQVELSPNTRLAEVKPVVTS